MEKQCWRRRGLIYQPRVSHPWRRSHAQIPTPDWTAEGALRIYFGTRDGQNRTSTIFVEVDSNEPTRVTREVDTPLLSLGRLGCFDDAGVMPACVVTAGSEKRLYYAGWNTSTTVSYRLSIGLAISN